MSSKSTHYKAGLALGTALGLAAISTLGTVPALVAMGGATAGSSAPDWLEISWHDRGERKSIIPHRRVTHWLLGWILACLASLAVFLRYTGAYWAVFLLAFLLSGLLHVGMDALTPMGVPVLHPWNRLRLRSAHKGRALG